MLRPNTTHRSNPLPVDKELEAVITLAYDADQYEEGDWGYDVSDGNPSPWTVDGTVKVIRAYADGADGTISINGGPNITVREGTGFDLTPYKGLVSPTITYSAGVDVFVELA